jgi:centrosomal CEP192-like protein/HYDIN/CFA65/VesB family protein
MRHLPTRWNAVVVVLALATMVGCQGLSTSKSNVQTGQSPLLGTLTAGPASVSFGNVQVGTSQTQSDTLTNTGVTNLTITQADVTGPGFSTTGLSLPLTLIPAQSTTFSVVFAPQSAGSASGTLALTNNGSSSTVSVALAGTAVVAGGLSATPTSFTFGSLQVGTNQTQTETLKNIGGDSLTISQATVSGAGFSYTGLSLPLTLAANQSTTFGVVFAPTVAGASSGSLSLTVSGSSTTVDIALSGTGAAPATLTATPASLTFTNITVGKNQAQTETVKNIGGENATISAATAAGTGFSIAGISAPVTLTPGQSASFTVTFAPESAGSFPGSVAIDSNATNPTLTIGLTGSAVTQSVGTLAVSSVNVGSVVVGTSGTQSGTLSASGASVSVSSVSLSGTNPSEFSISGLTFPVTVTTTQSVPFTVKFTPGATGTATASASFASTASNTPTAGSLSGTGTAAPVHAVSLTWTASTTTGVTSYNVYRAIYSGSACGSYTNIGSSPSSTPAYTDSVVADGTTYCYATTAVDPSGESAYSNVTQAVIPAP